MLQGAKPNIYYCQHGSSSVKIVWSGPPPMAAKGGKPEKQGTALRSDNKRPIVSLAHHPSGDSRRKQKPLSISFEQQLPKGPLTRLLAASTLPALPCRHVAWVSV